MLSIKVLGSGCPNCQRLEQEVRASLEGSGIDFEVTKVTDYSDIASYGILRTPGLVINETVLSVGRIPNRQQILEWANEANQSHN
ncbi:MAG: thioredoxin family protein [Chloroflexi bacterium]|nr:thioredoxin family protein [Chloroflexota bacterium]